jgi:predicted lipoprotein with Yx(FWY)xxD motif
MPKQLVALGAVVIAVLATTAIATAATGGNRAFPVEYSASTGAKVAVGKAALGRILVDGRGRTLYMFAKDKHGKSSCGGACAGFWPPLITAGKPIAKAGARASLLGTTRRADGRLQVTYNHHPLYTFVKDTRKGQTNGEEVDTFGAEWYAVSATGAKVEKAGMTDSSTSDPSSGGYGYGSGYGY